jgi:hypothetical protein
VSSALIWASGSIPASAFAHGVHELAAKLGRHAPHLGRRLTHLAHNARKFLRPDDDQRHDPDDDELARVKIEHEETSLKVYLR